MERARDRREVPERIVRQLREKELVVNVRRVRHQEGVTLEIVAAAWRQGNDDPDQPGWIRLRRRWHRKRKGTQYEHDRPGASGPILSSMSIIDHRQPTS
jgi:hypothetical protein